jgi:ribonuclease G
VTRTLLLSAGPGEIRGALVENGQAVDYRIERRRGGSRVGDIVLGRVVGALPGTGGLLVEIGEERPAFLDAGQVAAPAAPHEGQPVLVQVSRDPQAAKAANVTMRVVLEGRLLAYDPTRPGVRAGRRLDPAECGRLTASVAALAGAEEGFLLRPDAAGATEAAFAEDIAALRARWQAIGERGRAAVPPTLLAAESEPVGRLLADFAEAGLAEIVVDSRGAYAAARRWLAERRPELGEALRLHPEGEPLFQAFGVDEDLARLLAAEVPLASGGRLIIEPAAAATMIDVDTGGAPARGDAARAALAVNRAAAREAARQIRLRGLAGAIVVDFVSMKRRGDRDRVLAELAEALASDPAEPQILGWTRLGHVELIRRRRRRPLAEIVMERRAPWRPTAETVALEALRRAAREAETSPGRVPALVVSPDVAVALGREAAAAKAELEAELHRPVPVSADETLAREAFDIRLV